MHGAPCDFSATQRRTLHYLRQLVPPRLALPCHPKARDKPGVCALRGATLEWRLWIVFEKQLNLPRDAFSG